MLPRKRVQGSGMSGIKRGSDETGDSIGDSIIRPFDP